MKPNKNRNYKIYCVKYEDIFDKQDELSSLLGVGKLNMVNKSKGEIAYNVIDVDSEPSKNVIEGLSELDGVITVRVLGNG